MKIRNEQGFTLIEIVLALGILTIGIVSVMSLFPVGLDSSRKAQDYTDAALLANYKMAELTYNIDVYNDNYNSVVPTGSYPKAGTNPRPFDINPAYSWNYSSSTASSFSAHSLYRIDLWIYATHDTSEAIYSVTTYLRTK